MAKKMIFGIMPDENQAKMAKEDLKNSGYNPEEVSIVAKSVSGELLGRSSRALPGGFIAGGLLSQAIGEAGNLAESLTGFGLPREEAEMLEKNLQQGKVLMGVTSEEDKENAAAGILARHKAGNVEVLPISEKKQGQQGKESQGNESQKSSQEGQSGGQVTREQYEKLQQGVNRLQKEVSSLQDELRQKEQQG